MRARVLVQLAREQAVAPGCGLELPAAPAPSSSRRRDDFWEIEFDGEALAVFERHGEMPLPPYIARAAEAADRERYQTVYAREPGAVAAPDRGPALRR